MGVRDGFIRNIYISCNGNDLKTYIPFMEKYKKACGELPKKTPADADYGSFDNYSWCRENCINQFEDIINLEKFYRKTTEEIMKQYLYQKGNGHNDQGFNLTNEELNILDVLIQI